jgi:glycosyltransferase involved in cell wall biosynthesis
MSSSAPNSDSPAAIPAIAPAHPASAQTGGDVFVFLEVFENEGGIQAYNRILLEAYSTLARSNAAEVFILRDSDGCHNPISQSAVRFRYFKNSVALLGRVHLTLQLLWRLLQRRPRQVFCGHVNLARMVQLLCQPLGIPYVVLTYGKEVWVPLPSAMRSALQQAEAVWIISRYSRDLACAANQLDPQRVKLLPCCVDGDEFCPGPQPTHLRDRYQLHGAKVLMTVARLWSGDIYKGVDITIRALPAIVKAVPSVKYLAIGRGDDRPRLERLAQELGVADRVVFAGFVPTTELPNHYRLADLYVMPSQEGFGIVYLEAMACGVPVIGGDNDGSADPLQDGRLGWQVPHRDPEAVAAACIAALSGTDPRSNGDWLREETLACYSKPAFAAHLNKLLSDDPPE